MNTKKNILGVGICLSLMGTLQAFAQQTIFNVPSADITAKKQIYLEQESQFRPWNPGAYWDGTQYFAVGIGHNTDLESTLYNVSDPHSDNISLGLGFKSAIPLFTQTMLKDREIKLTIGAQAIPSLQGHGFGEWAYTTLSGRLPVLKTRLTAGVSEGTHQLFGRNVVSFTGGIEQPVTTNFSLLSDWYSGTHGLGFWTSGFAYAFPKDFTLYAGFQIPNNSRVGKSGFTLELAKLLQFK